MIWLFVGEVYFSLYTSYENNLYLLLQARQDANHFLELKMMSPNQINYKSLKWLGGKTNEIC